MEFKDSAASITPMDAVQWANHCQSECSYYYKERDIERDVWTHPELCQGHFYCVEMLLARGVRCFQGHCNKGKVEIAALIRTHSQSKLPLDVKQLQIMETGNSEDCCQ